MAASRLFAEGGFRATSMVAVAEAAGLSQTGLSHHYGSKEELLAAVLERRDSRDMDALRGSDPALWDGWEVLDWLVRLVEHNSGHSGVVQLFTAMTGEAVDADHPAHDWLRRHYDSSLHLVCGALQRAVDDGRARPDTPIDRIARNCFALMDGLQIQWLLDPDAVDMAANFADYVSAVRARWEVGGSLT